MTQIGIIRHDKRISPDTQREALERWGAEVIWDLGKQGQSLSNFLSLRSARKGDTIGIWRIALLPDRGRGSYDKMSADMSALLKIGARILELESGRYCDTKADVAELVSMALKQIATGKRGMKAEGRPRKLNLSDADIEWIGLQWARKDLRNNQQRVAAVQRRFETFQVYDYYRLRDRIAAGIKKA